jgi:hypothetical protein
MLIDRWFFKRALRPLIRGGLAIVAMRLWSQWIFQSPIQNVKKGPFEGILEAFWIFLYGMSERPCDPSQRPFDSSPLIIEYDNEMHQLWIDMAAFLTAAEKLKLQKYYLNRCILNIISLPTIIWMVRSQNLNSSFLHGYHHT